VAQQTTSARRRSRLVWVAGALGAAAIAVIVVLLLTGGRTIDPFAYHTAERAQFEARGAAGESHLLYANSPGGVVATARRVAAFNAPIQSAAAAAHVDPGLLEAMVFLESGGRPDVVAGPDPSAAAGVTQIVASTGQSLLGMHIDLKASRRLTKQIAAAQRRKDAAAVARLQAQRRKVDDRFDPNKAIAATGRYLAFALPRFGRPDFAVASYHMGIGNLADAIRGYVGPKEKRLAVKIVREDKLTYAQLYYDSSPFRHKTAYRRLADLGDNSNTYYWRVLAARDIMRLYRQNPAELQQLNRLETGYGSAEAVLRPPGVTPVFANAAAVDQGLHRGELVKVPHQPGKRHFTLDTASVRSRAALRAEALALLYYLADRVHAIGHEKGPLTVGATVRDGVAQQALVARHAEKPGYAVITTGYSFDVERRYASQAQAEAFQAMLDRLQALDVIAWERRPDVIHITVSSYAKPLTPLLHDASLSSDA
jgi:Transglycosylase SLT domain